MREEQALNNIMVDDIKKLHKFVKDKSGVVSEEMGKQAEEIDVQDLVNVMMDVSLDFFSKDEHEKP